jgi:phage tail-like protein
MKRAEIEQLLPSIFQRTAKPGSPLVAVLETMEALHGPSEEVLGRLDEFFNPRRTRDDFVPLLARWLDLAFLLETPGGDKLKTRSSATISSGLGRLRELVASAAELSKWTGTAQGLRRFLQIATGEDGFEIRENVDRDGQPRPFHLTVVAPTRMQPHRDLIERIIASEKPAYVTSDLVIPAKKG